MLRLYAEPGYRRRLAVFPGVKRAFAAALALGAVAVTVLAFAAPLGLRMVTIGAAGALLFERWRAREGLGRSRGLPLGSLALAPHAPWRDQRFFEKQATRHGPIFKMTHAVRDPMVCVVGLERAIELLRVHDDSLRTIPLPFNRHVQGGVLRYMEPELHQAYRAVLRTALTRQVVDDCRPFVTAWVHRKVSEMAALSTAAESGLQPRDAIREMALVLFARIFFGLPPDSEECRRALALYGVIDIYKADRVSFRKVQDALRELEALLRGQLARFPALTTSDGAATRSFAAVIIRADPAILDDPTVFRNLIYLLQTSAVDVTALLVWTIKMLADHPQWGERLRAEPSDDLATRIVMETLRLEQSEFLMREVTRNIFFDGYVIPKGWMLRVCVHESHRSSAVFESAESFDPDRFRDHKFMRSDYSPFGASRIACLGVHLSLTVGAIFVRELVSGFEMSVVSDGPPEFGGFHWRPSSRFRLRLVPRAGYPQPAAQPAARTGYS